jgi:tetratricopeptide (TPR) repeat protein
LHLFRLGDYYRAITELKRVSLLFPDLRQRPAAQLLIGLALQEDGLYDDAFVHLQQLQQTDGRTDIGRVAAFKLGELRFQQEQYRQAISQWQQFLRVFPDGPLVPQTTYLLGLATALDRQPAQAQHFLAAVPAGHALSEQALALQSALESAPPAPTKSPATAGLLAALLPGAGHLYIGKPGQALAAFLLNGAFLTGAAFAFQEGLEVVGGILLYFEAGWYLGNINSARDGARDTQSQAQQAFATALRNTYALPPLTFERLQAPGVGLRIAF